MDWRDEGMLLAVRPHGESSAIIEVLTAEHGRHAGLVRGARGRAMAPVLQPGAQLGLEWRARLAEHLGHYRVEPLSGRAAAIMADAATLGALNALVALLALLPEREPNPGLYAATVGLADRLAEDDPDWPGVYAVWELDLLEALGFPLDLSRCAVTGEGHDLAHVSPRSGRAVARGAAGDWAGRLLPLPAALRERRGTGAAEALEALAVTGHFLTRWVCPAFERPALPDARVRLLGLLGRRAALAMRPPIG